MSPRSASLLFVLITSAFSSDIDTAALAADSECSSPNSTSCAIHALQRKASVVDGANVEPKRWTVDGRWISEDSDLGVGNSPIMASSISKMGYQYVATTTRYGSNCCTECDFNTFKLVEGTDYHAVAAAQSMRGHAAGMAHMTCGSCAKGRFVRKLPRGFHVWTPESDSIFHTQYNIVVGDLCPHNTNAAWCPADAGQKNKFGAENHFDFGNPPASFDNFYFVFTPMECSSEIKQRIARAKCSC